MKYRALRWVCEFPTVIWHEKSVQNAEIRSVSNTGAQLYFSSDLKPGDKIELKCRLERISGIVVWVKEILCGVEFSRPIGEEQLSIIHQPGGHGSALGHRSTNFAKSHGFRELK